MSRGFKKDLPATEAAHFADPRSFVSLPKLIVGECTEPKPHLVLHGVDKGPIRAEIFRRNRKEIVRDGGITACWKCGHRVFEMADPGHQMRGEWDHIRNKPGERCDCPENGRVACRECHSERHPQTQFGRSKIVEELC